jgi:hypothetical protein
MIFLEREYKVNYGIENYIFIVKKEKWMMIKNRKCKNCNYCNLDLIYFGVSG